MCVPELGEKNPRGISPGISKGYCRTPFMLRRQTGQTAAKPV
ncbi:hypothetical protein OKW34_000211 [Paraburkholderia youngii]